MEKKKLLPRLAELYLAFFRTGIFTFGGGLAMMPMLKRELIDSRGWITEEELIDYYFIEELVDYYFLEDLVDYSFLVDLVDLVH